MIRGNVYLRTTTPLKGQLTFSKTNNLFKIVTNNQTVYVPGNEIVRVTEHNNRK